eukprot:GEMP01053119.1.p1 GENE.GEMP01053119.1~~GEMP01053119.1.p1  ORF type:complete len:448 (+),score=23.83 GEMP01053119.1:71-1414(+)
MMIKILGKHTSARYSWCLPRFTGARWFSSNLPQPTCLPYNGKEDLQRINKLEIEIDEARKRPRWTWSQTSRSRRGFERVNPEGNLFCYRCGTFKNPSAFYVDTGNILYGRQSPCKACFWNLRNHTLRGALNTILHAAKARAVNRSTMPGREEAGRFELDLDFLFNLWLKQQGRCAYSGLVMNVEPHTAWRFSLERRNNRLGYIPSNVVFSCAEFNISDRAIQATYHVVGSAQWSREKVHSLPRLISASNPMSDREIDALVSANTVRRQKSPNRKVAPHGNLLCSKCGQYKPPLDFPLNSAGFCGRSSICHECQAEYRWSLLGFFRSRHHAAKSAAKMKASKGRKGAGVFDLLLSDIVELYKLQQGRCYYSGIKLTLKPVSEWMCSLERLDNTKGYTVENVVLICSEFQSSDRSLSAKGPVKGTAQWSKEKVAMLVQWLNATKSTLGK